MRFPNDRLAKKCAKCGALNANTMTICGSCKTPLDGTEAVERQSESSWGSGSNARREKDPIRKMLGSSLLRIESNVRDHARSPSGRMVFAGRRTYIIGFKSEYEEVTLTVPPNGPAFLGDDFASKHNIDFKGPEKDLLALLENGRDISRIPESVEVRIGGRESLPGTIFLHPSLESQTIFREAAANALRAILK